MLDLRSAETGDLIHDKRQMVIHPDPAPRRRISRVDCAGGAQVDVFITPAEIGNELEAIALLPTRPPLPRQPDQAAV